ncbi:MAG: peptidoglycan-binding domain-containing protein [Syntrophotaleaceae bacterium]
MRRIVLITTMAFIAGLFTVSQGLGAGEYGQDQVSEDAAGMDQGTTGMDQGTTGMDQGTTGMDEGATGMDQGMSGMDPTTAAVQLDSSQISEVQRLLQEQGYDPGSTDGVMGTQTQEALRNFQESQGLAASGEPTEETLRALAPDAETQEMLGISPEFGQDQMQQDQMQEPMQPEEMGQEQPQDGGIGESEPQGSTY